LVVFQLWTLNERLDGCAKIRMSQKYFIGLDLNFETYLAKVVKDKAMKRQKITICYYTCHHIYI